MSFTITNNSPYIDQLIALAAQNPAPQQDADKKDNIKTIDEITDTVTITGATLTEDGELYLHASTNPEKKQTGLSRDAPNHVSNLTPVIPGVPQPAPEWEIEERDTLEAASASGTKVSVTRHPGELLPSEAAQSTAESSETLPAQPSYSVQLARADGSSLSLTFTDNIRIHEQKGGNTAVYFAESNTTRTYDAKGAYSEAQGNTIAADVASIYVNTQSDSLHTGNGDNLVFNWADNADITTGNGNDTIVLRDHAQGNTIHSGNGNDTIKGKKVSNSTFDLGEGNNTLDISGILDSQIIAGDGNNYIQVRNGKKERHYSGSSGLGNTFVQLGNGNNFIDTGGLYRNSQMSCGNGNNKFIGDVSGDSLLNLGDGDNTIKSRNVSANIELGNGNNYVDIHELGYDASLNIGNGHNKLLMNSIIDNSTITIGDGNNLISAYYLTEQSSMTLGNGNNIVRTGGFKDKSTVSLGDGNNIVQSPLQNDASLTLGDGDNALYLWQITDTAELSVGEGNNQISVITMQDQSSMRTGDGDNTITIRNVRDQASLELGTGDNLLMINEAADDAAMGDGVQSLEQLRKNGQSTYQLYDEYNRRIRERKDQDLPTVVFSLQDNAQDPYLHQYLAKRRENPSYFYDMDPAQRLKLLMQDFGSDVTGLLWHDAFADRDTFKALDTYV